MARNPFLFSVPALPKGDYLALQWARAKLDQLAAEVPDFPPPPAVSVPSGNTGQREVLVLGIRLVTLMLQGGLDLETVLKIGQERSVLALLRDFRVTPPSQGEGSVRVPGA